MLKDKSILNVYINLSSLYHWAVDAGFAQTNLIQSIKIVKPAKVVIQPYTQSDLKRLLQACEQSEKGPSQSTQAYQRPTRWRDRAILLLLVDTGMRAAELCQLRLDDLDLVSGLLKVTGKGPGNDGKQRFVPIGKRASLALKEHLQTRPLQPSDPLFSVGPKGEERPLHEDVLYKLITRLGARAGVTHPTVHRFRHTFAINFLRNGGNALVLQRILGHATLEMVNRYVAIAEYDLSLAQKTASPADGWRL